MKGMGVPMCVGHSEPRAQGRLLVGADQARPTCSEGLGPHDRWGDRGSCGVVKDVVTTSQLPPT